MGVLGPTDGTSPKKFMTKSSLGGTLFGGPTLPGGGPRFPVLFRPLFRRKSDDFDPPKPPLNPLRIDICEKSGRDRAKNFFF